MTSNFIKCPFCAKEIRFDAIKCDACGNLLIKGKNYAHYEITERTQALIPQNFEIAIIIGMAAIFPSIFSEFIDENNSLISWIFLFGNIFTIKLLLYFRKYLKNFEATKAIKLVNWQIIFIILAAVMQFFAIISQSKLINLFNFALVLYLFAAIVIAIIMGISLQKIKNDFVGLLKECGIAYTYLLPFGLLLEFIGYGINNRAISIFGSCIVMNIPIVIMIMIFIRAKEFENKK